MSRVEEGFDTIVHETGATFEGGRGGDEGLLLDVIGDVVGGSNGEGDQVTVLRDDDRLDDKEKGSP